MRAFISGLAAILLAAVAYWQVPGVFPLPVRRFIGHGLSSLRDTLGFAPQPAIDMGPVWPMPPMTHAWPSVWLILPTALALAVLSVALVVWSRRRAAAHAPAPPAWLASARAYSGNGAAGRTKRAQCDVLEQRLVPDMRRRGEGALARAHQLDLYWRFVSRTRGAKHGNAKGAELADWMKATKSALDATAIAPSAGSRAAFEAMRPNLGVLKREDAGAVKDYYDRLAALLSEHQETWKRASEAISAATPDQGACLEAMEELRQINRAIAKESASLVGDIEIRVRALDH
jgi:hypothetical protein